MEKVRVWLLFGGRSVEHEVSLLSARNVLASIDRRRFEPLLVGIDKGGAWRLASEKALEEATGDPTRLAFKHDGPEIAFPLHPPPHVAHSGATGHDPSLLRPDDVIFPVLHGTFGEDGTLQGLLELAGVAYVGSGTLGSAIGMDKEAAKRLLSQAGIPVVDYRVIRAEEIRKSRDAALASASEVGFPCFVKPANAGSSVGVHRVTSGNELGRAVAAALEFDRKVLVEKAIDAREIECAVLGNEDPEATLPGEIQLSRSHAFYSYQAKYVDPSAAQCVIPAPLPAEVAESVRMLSRRVFKVLELAGLARVDFFLDRVSGDLYVNEVNTLPGFTSNSMFPKLWQASGLDPMQLTTRLIDLAVERRNLRRSLKTGF